MESLLADLSPKDLEADANPSLKGFDLIDLERSLDLGIFTGSHRVESSSQGCEFSWKHFIWKWSFV